MLSLIPTYKDEPSAHGRCELEARRSVHPERMQVGALTSIWQVGVPPAEAQGVDSANSLFYKKVRSNISHGFTYSILLSTTSQRLAVPLSLQNGKRVACFPFTSFRILIFLQKCYSQNPPLVEANVLASAQPCLLMLRHSLMSLGSYSPVNLLIHTDSKHRLRPLSFLSRTGNVLHSFR